MVDALRIGGSSRSYAKLAVGIDIVSVAPDVSLQQARTWAEGVSSNFSTTALKEIFKGKKVVIFGLPGFVHNSMCLVTKTILLGAR
ncbi:peroxiredoxin-2F, mitochondrial [Hevea brasiliensis]|uniref:peroxiredoxin-2F, mitochondrial n=1 Tax=Hevea brasiliensis TaxID=3981 RepID=UPI0025F2C460|nr:peroxiredoxin-2F, mitochondrial [Hevea brasiliensis]